MPKKLISNIVCLVLLFVHSIAIATQNNISFDLQNVNIQDALHIFAKFSKKNIIISPEVTGTTTLHLQNMNQEEIFDLLLAARDLAKQKMGNAWYIAPKLEVEQRQQENLKLQIAFDETEPLVAKVLQIHFAKAEEITRLLQDGNNSLLSKRGHIRADLRTNRICIQDTPQHIENTENVIKRLDVPVQQVLIEARLASIDNDYERELGINFAVNKEPLPHHYSLAVAHLAGGSQLDIQLAALENAGHGDLISSPSLFTANQQTASIESGEEIPYQEVSPSGGTAVSFKKAVLSLKVTPQIMPDNKVLLQLEVTQDRPSNRIIQGVPAITTRQIMTNVLVNNCQTIVLGGVYEANNELDEQRIPFLGKIPLVGWLFKQQNVTSNKRELLIFVTPKIIPQER